MSLASILVIDSDPIIRARIARELRDLGYVVQESTDAEVRAVPDNIVSKGETVSGGGITIDNAGHRVSVDGHYIALAPREYRLLLFLVNNTDRVFSRKQLLIHVWDRDATVGPRTVDVHIRRLRSALEPFGYDRYLQTVRGTGYRFSLDT